MEAPKPISIKKNILVDFKEFYNYTEYYIKIFYTDDQELSIICFNIDKLDGIKYETNLKIEEIYNLNPILRQFINIKEIFEFILDLINENKIIIRRDNKILIFSFSITDIKQNTKTVDLNLINKDQNNSKEYIRILSKEIINLRNNISILTNEIITLKNNINNNKEIKELKDEIKEMKNIISKFSFKSNNGNGNNKDSIQKCNFCGKETDLKKCICGKFFCTKCISNNKNEECKNQCFLFNNDSNIITSYYQISKFPLPKNFEAKIKITSMEQSEWIRLGITFDSNIINEKRYYYDSPPYKIYYKGQRFYSYEENWIDEFISKSMSKGDEIIIKLKDGYLNYFQNGKSLGKSYPICKDFIKNNQMYLLIHRRNKNSECELISIYELMD